MTDEQFAEMARRFMAGESASMLGKAYGLTRNAVIGRLNRRGFKLCDAERERRQGWTGANKRIRAAKPKAAKSPKKPSSWSTTPRPPKAIAPPAATDVPRVHLLDLKRTHCRWPVGDPRDGGFGFCGLEADCGPYCAGHARIAYQSRKAA